MFQGNQICLSIWPMLLHLKGQKKNALHYQATKTLEGYCSVQNAQQHLNLDLMVGV